MLKLDSYVLIQSAILVSKSSTDHPRRRQGPRASPTRAPTNLILDIRPSSLPCTVLACLQDFEHFVIDPYISPTANISFRPKSERKDSAISMSQSQGQQQTQVAEQDESNSGASPAPSGNKKPSRALQRRPQQYDDDDDESEEEFVMPPKRKNRRMVPVHQSRIADRPMKKGAEDSSLKIKIELDLEVEVEIYARVKGDVTIGLM
ncbi:hypothetical protein FKW77_006068 [Venturia effusa]|uniref:Uncharacterized protein n=1 Tax=Venturia effusa TaxID=50376 RepID=A0A517LKA8_9PEZI|nr:hypothetical protein FKW77_006068 [Venturia effusa]